MVCCMSCTFSIRFFRSARSFLVSASRATMWRRALSSTLALLMRRSSGPRRAAAAVFSSPRTQPSSGRAASSCSNCELRRLRYCFSMRLWLWRARWCSVAAARGDSSGMYEDDSEGEDEGLVAAAAFLEARAVVRRLCLALLLALALGFPWAAPRGDDDLLDWRFLAGGGEGMAYRS